MARKLTRTIPEAVKRHVKAELTKQAERIVATQRSLAPAWARDRLHWTFGDAPKGGIALLTAGDGDLRVTFYTTDHKLAWFEFGTAERVQKTTGRSVGRITAQPHFYPGFRLWKRPAGAALKRAMRKGMKEGAR